jgi:alpha(1,3/1,4) fucosyltransferase
MSNSKKTIKINFKHFVKEDDPCIKFFIELLKKKYDVVISEKPDFIFFSIWGDETQKYFRKKDIIKKISPKLHQFIKNTGAGNTIRNSVFWKRIQKERIPDMKKDCVRIFYVAEDIVPDMKKCDWAFASAYEEEVNHPNYMRLPYYFLDSSGRNLHKKKIDFEKIKKEKKRFCNFLYSNNVEYRNRFFKKLSKYKKVDSPGFCMNNMPPIGDFNKPLSSRYSGNWDKDKLDFMKNYKFTIAFENSISSGWTTEKLTHPMMVNSIPIYLGNPEIGKEFNKKSFLSISSPKEIDWLIEKVIEIDQNDKLYEKMLKEPWFKNNKLNKYCDEKRYFRRFEEIFEK